MAIPLPPEQQEAKIICKLPGTGTPKERTRRECDALGGTEVPPDGNDGCFVRDIVTKSLGDLLLELGGTYKIATAFRDDILTPTTTGASLLASYYRHIPDAFDVVRVDAALLAESIEAWRAIYPFASAVVTIGSPEYAKVSKVTSFAMVYGEKANERFQNVLRTYQSATDNKKFKYFLSELMEEIDSYVGLTPKQAIERLGRD